MKLLLHTPGININGNDLNGMTPLMWAEERGYANITKLIRDRVDDLTSQAIDAIKQDNIELFKSIIAQIGINVIDSNGDTFLHKAIKHKRLEIVRFILFTDPSLLEICNAEGKDGIELSVGYPEIFELIKTLVPKENSCAHCSRPSDKRCGRCNKVHYCSVECQKHNWKAHKPNCTAA